MHTDTRQCKPMLIHMPSHRLAMIISKFFTCPLHRRDRTRACRHQYDTGNCILVVIIIVTIMDIQSQRNAIGTKVVCSFATSVLVSSRVIFF